MNPNSDPLLPFPRRVVIADENGRALSEEYDIPVNAKKKVLQEMYLFEDCPALDELLCDLHAGKQFAVVEFKVVRERDMNLLVSPYYYESGGTVIDWVPADWANEETD